LAGSRFGLPRGRWRLLAAGLVPLTQMAALPGVSTSTVMGVRVNFVGSKINSPR